MSRTSGLQIILLAAGKSSRFWPLNTSHKSCIRIGGHSLLYWTMKGVKEAGGKEVILIHHPGFPLTREIRDASPLKLTIIPVLMKKPTGSARAVHLARSHIRGRFFLLHPSHIHAGEVLDKLKSVPEKEAGILGAPCTNPKEYGVLERIGNKIVQIMENPTAPPPSCLRIIGSYVLPEDFLHMYDTLSPHREDDLIRILNAYIKQGRVRSSVFHKTVLSLKYPWHALEYSKFILKNRISYTRAKSSRIGKGVVIRGDVHIGKRSVIEDESVLEGPLYIGDDVHIGKSNVIGPSCTIEDKVRTGPLCKIDGSIIQERVRIDGGYVKDSIIGRGCRIRKQFFTRATREDKKEIVRTVQGKRVRTGRTSLGVCIGGGSTIGPGCTTYPGVRIGGKQVIGKDVHVKQDVLDE